MNLIPLLEEKRSLQNGLNDLENPKLPKLLTKPFKIITKQMKDVAPSDYIKPTASKAPTPWRQPSISSSPNPSVTNIKIKRHKGILNGMNNKNQMPVSTVKNIMKYKIPIKKVNQKGTQKVSHGDPIAAEMMSLNQRVQRLKQKLKEKLVESTLGDNFSVFEEFFQSAKPQPKDHRMLMPKKPVTLVRLNKSLPRISRKMPSKTIELPCTACGKPFKKSNMVQRNFVSPPQNIYPSLKGSALKKSKRTTSVRK